MLYCIEAERDLFSCHSDSKIAQQQILCKRSALKYRTCVRMPLRRTPLFLELRSRIVADGKRDDIVVLVAWLLTNFTDDGGIRSPSASRRSTIVLDGVRYWIVRRP